MRGAYWSDDLIARLTQLWTDGLSCSQIARALGIAILRFPGWQIVENARGCAREAINILIRISNNKKSEAA